MERDVCPSVNKGSREKEEARLENEDATETRENGPERWEDTTLAVTHKAHQEVSCCHPHLECECNEERPEHASGRAHVVIGSLHTGLAAARTSRHEMG